MRCQPACNLLSDTCIFALSLWIFAVSYTQPAFLSSIPQRGNVLSPAALLFAPCSALEPVCVTCFPFPTDWVVVEFVLYYVALVLGYFEVYIQDVLT